MRVRISRHRLALVVGYLVVATLAFLGGRAGSLSQATAEPSAPYQPQKVSLTQTTPSASSTDYSRRVVAYIYDTIPITREDLGEYLIARMEPDRLNNLVNRRIIEHACQQKGIEVTAAEVEADFHETIKRINVSKEDFVNKLLKPNHKTLYEWKEDATKPRLLMTKLCRERVHVTEQDIQDAFEAYFGEKIECQLILWPPEQHAHAMMAYPKIRDNEAEFDNAAKHQATPSLAAKGGKLEQPMGRHTTGNEEMEREAFKLQPGQISPLIKTPQGDVVIKCIKRIPPDTTKKLETERGKLSKEVYDKKLEIEIRKTFQQLRDQAHPNIFLNHELTEDELRHATEQELKSTAGSSAPLLQQSPAHGN